MCMYIYLFFFLRITNDRKTKLAAKTELSFANSQLDLLKEELEGINSTLDVYQFDRWISQIHQVFWVCFREKFVHLFVTGTVESLLSYKELEKENSCMQVREKDDKISVQSLERWLCDLRIKLLFLQQTKLNH